MTKKDFQNVLQDLKKLLETAKTDALQSAEKYSDDSQSRLAFEVGYLNGRINSVLETINYTEKQLAGRK